MRDQFMCDGIENFDFHVSRKVESQKRSHLILSGDYVPQKAQRILVERAKDFAGSSSFLACVTLSFCNASRMPSILKLKAKHLRKAFSDPRTTSFHHRPVVTERSRLG